MSARSVGSADPDGEDHERVLVGGALAPDVGAARLLDYPESHGAYSP